MEESTMKAKIEEKLAAEVKKALPKDPLTREEIESMHRADVAMRISQHLNRIEADPVLNETDKDYGTRSFYFAHCSNSGRKYSICYVSYQGSHTFDDEKVCDYLASLENGYGGRHYGVDDWDGEPQLGAGPLRYANPAIDEGQEPMPAKHPAYGLVRLSRHSVGGVSRTAGEDELISGAVLFGSPLRHRSVVSLTVARATLNRSHGENSYFRDEELIEIHFSETQFASLITSFGEGTGVPCTVSLVKGEGSIEDPPADTRLGSLDREMRQAFADLAGRLKNITRQAETVLGPGRKAKASDREKLLGAIERISQDIKYNLPFRAQQAFKEIRGVADNAKAEVDAYLSGQLHRMGMEALRSAAPQLFLPAEDEDGTD